jgi:ArsR family transcriptional regulator, cadmium/lead-responsive transcriptional repressor
MIHDRRLGPAVSLFHALADASRLTLVRRLSDGEARVTDLAAELGLAQSTVSGHLASLREAGLVTSRAEGRQMFYGLARPELIQLLSAAEELLVAAGDRVALVPRWDPPIPLPGVRGFHGSQPDEPGPA